MKVIGLTGGIACGKSAVCSVLKEKDVPIIDCDVIAHDVVEKGRWGYKRVVKVFGPDILLPNGDIDRAVLGKLIFEDATLRRRLNAAIHPPIAITLLSQLIRHWFAFRRVVVIDMPLLFETRSNRLTHAVVSLVASEDLQVSRLISRDGLDDGAARARVAAQMPTARKAELSDAVIENNGTLEELNAKAEALAERLGRSGDLAAQSQLTRVLTSPPVVIPAFFGVAAVVAKCVVLPAAAAFAATAATILR